MNNTITLFKLSTGEEILAKVLQSNQNDFTIDNVVSLVYQPTEDGRMTAGFAPYMPYSDGPITLNRIAIISYTEQIKDKVIEQYRRVFSDIVIAPAGSVNV